MSIVFLRIEDMHGEMMATFRNQDDDLHSCGIETICRGIEIKERKGKDTTEDNKGLDALKKHYGI